MTSNSLMRFDCVNEVAGMLWKNNKENMMKVSRLQI